MMAMTNLLFQMQRELYKLKRRTHRVERSLITKNKTAQPIIRLSRLTQGYSSVSSFVNRHRSSFLDQLSTICIDNTDNHMQESETTGDKCDVASVEQSQSNVKKTIKRLRRRPSNSS
jgi:hypothetical protein